MRLVLQANSLDDDADGQEKGPGPSRCQSGLAGNSTVVPLHEQIQDSITDRTSGKFTNNGPYRGRQPDSHANLCDVEMVYLTEGRGTGDREQYRADTKGITVVDEAEEHRWILEHDEAVCNVPQFHTPLTSSRSKGEEGQPIFRTLVCFTCRIVAVI